MIELGLENCRRVLALGAHADDLEIGCHGTLQKMRARGIEVDGLLLSGSEDRKAEQRKSFAEMGWTGRSEHFSFDDGLFPMQAAAIKQAIRGFIEGQSYDLVLVHATQDHHQDHYTLGHLAYNLFRNTLIWEYEIPKYDVDTPQPNVFIRLTEAEIEAKVSHLERNFASQAVKQWYGPETFRGLARLRGVQCNAPYAEAFLCRKAVMHL